MSCVDIPCDGAPFAPGPFDPGILRVPVLSVLPDSQHLRVLREAQNHQLGIAALAVDPGEPRGDDCGLPGQFAAPLQGVGLDYGTALLCGWLCIIIIGGGELAWIREKPSLGFIDLQTGTHAPHLWDFGGDWGVYWGACKAGPNSESRHHPQQLASSYFGPAEAERLRWRAILAQSLFLSLTKSAWETRCCECLAS